MPTHVLVIIVIIYMLGILSTYIGVKKNKLFNLFSGIFALITGSFLLISIMITP